MNVPEDEDQSSDVEAALIQATEELGTKGKVFIVKDCSHVTWYIVAENGKGALDKVKSLLKGD